MIHRTAVRLGRAWRRWNEDDGVLIAGAISYTASLSLFPLLLVLISVFGVVLRFTGWGRGSQTRLLDFIAAQTSGQLASQIGQLLSDVKARAFINGPIGVFALFLLAMALFINLDRAIDRIWRRRPESRGVLRAMGRVLFHRLRAFLMLLGAGLAVLISFAANLVLAAAETVAGPLSGYTLLWRAVRLATSLALNALLFTVVYRTLPKAVVPWRRAAQGGVLVSLIWEVGRLALSALVISDKYSAYGIVGAFIAILLWTYYASAIVLFGAEYVWVACNENPPPENDRKTDANATRCGRQ